MPACSSTFSSFPNVLSHSNAMPQTQNMTPKAITVYTALYIDV